MEGTAPTCLREVCRENTFMFTECMWMLLLISERPAIISIYKFYLIITEKCLLRDASCIFYYNSGSCQPFEVLISPFCLGGVHV